MSVRITLNSAVGDLSRNAFDNNIAHNLLYQVMRKINVSNVVKPENKSMLNNYFSVSSQNVSDTPIDISRLSAQDQLLITATYYLSDLNNYDFTLINSAFDFGLGVSDVIVLLLLDNIYDISTFCNKHGLVADFHHTIATLKKLSALHKIQYNF